MANLDNDFLAIQTDDDVLFAKVRTENLDQISIGAIRAAIEENVSEIAQGIVNLDLTKVAFAGSVAIGQLIQLQQTLKNNGKKLILSNLNSTVKEIVRISKLDTVIKIE